MNYESNLTEVLSDLQSRLLDLETSHQEHEDAAALVEDEVASQIGTAFDDFDPAYHDILTLDMLDSEVKPYVEGIVDAALERRDDRLRDAEHTILALTRDLQATSASLARLREFVTRETWMDRVKGWFLTLRNRVV